MSDFILKPLHDRVVIKRSEGEKRTAAGIIIPESSKEKPLEGKVVAIGDGKFLENGNRRPMELKVGDTVIFGKYGTNEIQLNNKLYLVINEENIIGIINKAKENI
jgi:chaperonin GroES